jgi:hypothetical protein
MSRNLCAKICPACKPAAPRLAPAGVNLPVAGDSRNSGLTPSAAESSDSSSTRSAASDAQTSSRNFSRASESNATAWCSKSLTCPQPGAVMVKLFYSFRDGDALSLGTWRIQTIRAPRCRQSLTCREESRLRSRIASRTLICQERVAALEKGVLDFAWSPKSRRSVYGTISTGVRPAVSSQTSCKSSLERAMQPLVQSRVL